MLDQHLRDLLVCPVDHAGLRDVDDGLQCTRCGRIYPIIDGIPSMVPDETSDQSAAS